MCLCAQAWDETDIFDLLVKNGGGEVVRGPNEGTSMASTYSTEQQELLLHLGQLLYSVFDDLITVFDYEAMNDPLTGEGTDKLSMLGFLHLLKKCNVPHPDVPMASFDRIFVEVNWTADPSPDSSDKSMDLGEFMEALIRVAETRYAVEDPRPDMVESLRMLLEEKILPMAADAHADPFLGVWHSKDFLNRLAHKSQMLTKAFTSVSNVDADMHFFTMSLKEWTVFVNKLNIVGDGFAQRSIKDTFWRAQGAWAPEFGTMVALKEREEFLEKLHATDEQEAADHGNTQEMVRAGPFRTPNCCSKNSFASPVPSPLRVSPVDDALTPTCLRQNYLEFVEGVARVAFTMYQNTLPEDKREEIDWAAGATKEGLAKHLDALLVHIKDLISSGTFS